MEGVDAEKELEWLRKAKKSTSKTPQMKYVKKGAGIAKNSTNGNGSAATNGNSLDTKEFQERMRKMQYAQLPINSFSRSPRRKV